MDTWAEIRRLYRAEKVPIKQIARDLGIGRNTVRRALRGEDPPDRSRGPRGSKVDPFVPAIRVLLAQYPRMPATVIAQRVGWEFSASLFRDWVGELRPEYLGIDPADRLSYAAVAVTWSESVDKHGVPRDETLWAMSHPVHVVREFGRPRTGTVAPTLFIGPSRMGTLEVLAVISPPDGVHVFHVMPLRESTRIAAGYQEGERP